MSVKELKALWQELYGASTNTRNRPYLQKRLAFRVQELAQGGGLSARGKDKADSLVAGTPGPRTKVASSARRSSGDASASKKERDSRLPKAGSTLNREYKGKSYDVTVHDLDFEYDGKRYASLSAIAKEITGQVWNGFLFFGIASQAKKGAA
jgi:hypothetical protein